MINLSNTIIQKVLILLLLTATGPEVFVSAMSTFISVSYDTLEDSFTNMKSL